MKYRGTNFETWFKQELKDPTLKKEYDRLQPEFAVINAMIEARRKKGMTQEKLAKKIGTKQSVISRLETGRGNPTLSVLKKLAEALDAHLEIRFA